MSVDFINEPAVAFETEQNGNGLPVKKLLFFGVGYFISHFIRRMSSEYHCIIVCPDDAPEIEEWKDNKNISFNSGDVNSIVLWKRLPLEEVSHIIFSSIYLSDSDVIEEICHAAREVFKLDIPVICIGDRNKIPVFFEKYGVVSVDPVEIGIRAITYIVNSNYAIPSNIGLGKGEMVEVQIFRRSHIVNRKLRYMESSRWRVAAIYRFDELVIPNGDSMMMVGDRVVLVGEPSMLTNIVKILQQGVPQFPLQFGNYVNVLADGESISNLEEANYLNRNINTNGFNIFVKKGGEQSIKDNSVVSSMQVNAVNSVESYKNRSIINDAGLVVIRVPESFSLLSFRIRYFVRNCPCPLLLSKGSVPYSCVIASLNSDNPEQSLQVAVELSSLLSVPLKIVYAAAPQDLRDAKLTEEYEDRLRIIKELESIDRTKHEFTLLEGNPVRETILFQKEYPRALFLIGNDRNRRITILEPHIPYLLAERLTCSTLIIPLVQA